MSHTHAQPSESAATKQSWQMPDTLILIFFVGIFAAILTYLIPAGHFDNQQVSYVVDGAEKTRTVIDPSSFSYATDENGELVYNKVGLFASGGGIGLMNFPFEGLVSGSKWGSAIGVIMFMLVIGGAFGVVMRTGTIDNGILRLIDKTKGNEALFIPVLFLLFSLGGAVFGMGEEAVAFAIIIAPLMVCDSDWFCDILDEPILGCDCTRYCWYSCTIGHDGSYGTLGWFYTHRYRLYDGLCVSHQSKS